MSLVRTQQLSIAFGHHALLDEAEFILQPNERVCIVGRNGEGKSTLLKMIAGMITPDSGQIETHQSAKICYLNQTLPMDDQSTNLYQYIASGFGDLGKLLDSYHQLSQTVNDDDKSSLDKLHRLQNQLDQQDGWTLDHKIQALLSKFQLQGGQQLNALSGGWKRRASLAKALVTDPNILLLDEPTNHLDIPMIQWLEGFLIGFNGAIIFVSHDRAFIDKVATRIVELDRGTLRSFPGNYQTYLEKKAALEKSEAEQNALFDKRLAEEETWIRQGIKARRTRNEGRVRALVAMRNERANRRQRQGKAKVVINEAERSGKLVAELTDLSFSIDKTPIVSHLTTTILQGDKVGIVGPNGIGKSTLINLILGKLKQDAGHIRLGKRLEVAYFDQKRETLDENKTVIDTLAEGQTMLTVGGRSRHAISYLRDFLFAPERARSPVKTLSGGERNRLLLAKLFLRPSNCLILDEPTNDLDIETLELLEDRLVQYQGTVLLVSHDRKFLDNVVTSCLVFGEGGKIIEHVGGYSNIKPAETKKQKVTEAKPNTTPKDKQKRKLSFNEQRELKQLPEKIEQLEEQIATFEAKMAQPDFYQQDEDTIKQEVATSEQLRTDLEAAYHRWEELEDE